MTRSGHDARRPPEATIPAGGSAPARQSRVPDIEARAAARLIVLAVLVRILQSRQFWEGLAVGAIVLAALARMGKENQAGAMARLAAWNKRQVQFGAGGFSLPRSVVPLRSARSGRSCPEAVRVLESPVRSAGPGPGSLARGTHVRQLQLPPDNATGDHGRLPPVTRAPKPPWAANPGVSPEPTFAIEN
jgi:hypothetical protein